MDKKKITKKSLAVVLAATTMMTSTAVTTYADETQSSTDDIATELPNDEPVDSMPVEDNDSSDNVVANKNTSVVNDVNNVEANNVPNEDVQNANTDSDEDVISPVPVALFAVDGAEQPVVENSEKPTTDPADLQSAITALREKIAEANAKGYTGNIIKDANVWAEFEDALNNANTLESHVDDSGNTTDTLEEINAATTRLNNAIIAADEVKAAQDEADKQAQVDGVKREIQDLLNDDKIPTQDQIFPSVWEPLNTAVTNANTAIENADLLYDDAISTRDTLASAIETAKANVEVKAAADEAKIGIKEVLAEIDAKHFKQNEVSNVLWDALQTAITEASTVYEDPEAIATTINEKLANLNAAYADVDYVVNGTVTLSSQIAGTSNSISLTGLGLSKETNALIAETSTIESNEATKIKVALTYTEPVVEPTEEELLAEAKSTLQAKLDEAAKYMITNTEGVEVVDETIITDAEIATNLNSAVLKAQSALSQEATIDVITSSTESLISALEAANTFVEANANPDTPVVQSVEPTTDTVKEPTTYYTCPEAGTIKLIIPLTKNFDGLKKVYLYKLDETETTYTAVDASKMSIANNILSVELTKNVDFDTFKNSVDTKYFGIYAMSRVPLTADGVQDKSDLEEITTTTITDHVSDVTMTSDKVDFTDAKLEANITIINNTNTTVDIAVYDKDNNDIDFGGNTASVLVPLENGSIAAANKLYVYNVVDDVYTEVPNTLTYRRVSFNVTGSGKYVISSVKLDKDGKVPSDTEAPVYETNTDYPNKESFTKGQFEDILAQNTTQDVVIRNNEGITFTFEANTMTAVENIANYDFSTKIETSFNNLTNLPNAISEDNFVMHVDYAYAGELPAMAKIRIQVGSKWAGVKLYYSQILDDGSVRQVQIIRPDANGFVEISQDHCSNYVFTTESIEKSTTPDAPPKDDDDEIVEGTTATTIKSETYGISVTTKTIVPNGAKLEVNVTDVDDKDATTTKYTSFTVRNGVGNLSALRGKATVSIPLGDRFSNASKVYVYVTDALTPVAAEIKDGNIVFEVADITKLIAISTGKWSEDAIPANVVSMKVKDSVLTDNIVTLTGKLPEGAKLKVEKLDRNTTSFGIVISLLNANGNKIAFNDDFMTAKAAVKLDEKYKSASKLYVYAIPTNVNRAQFTNSDYVLVNSSVKNGDLTFTLDDFGTYVISMVALDKDGNYIEANAIESAKDALKNYIKANTIDTSKYDSALASKYNTALKAANDVIKNDEATMEQIEKATTDLEAVVNTIKDLDKVKTAKADLQKLVTANKSIKVADYNEAIVNKINTAIKAAETAIADKGATLKEVETATSNLNKALEEAKTAVKDAKKELQTLVDTKVDLNDASSYVVSKYNKAKTDANTVIKNEKATLNNIEVAKKALKEAIDAVNNVYNVDTVKQEIRELLNKNIVGSKYTAASFAVYTNAMNKAKALLDNKDATLEEADTVKNALKKAIDGLVESNNNNNAPKPNVNPNPNTNGNNNGYKPDGNPNTGVASTATANGLMAGLSGIIASIASIFKKRKIKK